MDSDPGQSCTEAVHVDGRMPLFKLMTAELQCLPKLPTSALCLIYFETMYTMEVLQLRPTLQPLAGGKQYALCLSAATRRQQHMPLLGARSPFV